MVNTAILRKAITNLGFAEVARRAYLTERHLRTLVNNENSKVLPSTRHLLSKAIGVKPDDLFPFDPNQLQSSNTTKTASKQS
jgi:hypothetical protein